MATNLGMVAINIVGLPSWELMQSIIGLKSPRGFRYFTVGEYRRPLPLDKSRDLIIKEFLSDKSMEWLLFVDSDAVLHPLTLNRLLSWKKPIVSALCFTRTTPIIPSVYGERNTEGKVRTQIQEVIEWITKHPQLLTRSATILQEPEPWALIESTFVGMHTTLIRREVVEAMEELYFLTDPESTKGAGEDVWFCDRAAELGFKSYVDLSVISGHQALHEFAGLDFQAWVLWMAQQGEYMKKQHEAEENV